jgi:HAD superfamily hydrolase (TIGR01450 family)
MTETPDGSWRHLAGSDVPLAAAFDAALFDLDGVVYRGAYAVPHAAEAIRAARADGLRTMFITNNANREPGAVADHLSTLGVAAEAGDVVTSAQVAAKLLADELPAGSRVLVVGGAGLDTAVREVGLTLVSSADDAPDAVVQGFAPTVGWAELTEASYAVRAGARYVATNLDLTIPTDRGIAPGNGTLVGVVRAATGVEPTSAGKPEPAMFTLAAERAGAARPLVVGDRLDTDLAGARAAGQHGLLVLTGVSGPADAVAARPEERPHFLGLDLRALLEPHPAPHRDDDGTWRCGSASARVEAARVVVDDGDGWSGDLASGEAAVTVSLDALRALCCAAWEAQDGGRDVPHLTDLRVAAEQDGPAR